MNQYFLLFIHRLVIERLRNRSMCKGGAFERIKKEVENEPQKLKWSILSILYVIFVVVFLLFFCYGGKHGLFPGIFSNNAAEYYTCNIKC